MRPNSVYFGCALNSPLFTINMILHLTVATLIYFRSSFLSITRLPLYVAQVHACIGWIVTESVALRRLTRLLWLFYSLCDCARNVQLSVNESIRKRTFPLSSLAFHDGSYRFCLALASLSFGINLMLTKAIKYCWLPFTLSSHSVILSSKPKWMCCVNLDSNLDMSMRCRPERRSNIHSMHLWNTKLVNIGETKPGSKW